MQDGLYYIARAAEMDGQGIVRDVEVLYSSMEGMGTKDERLCYRLIRLSWNKPRFAAIKSQFQATYRKSLVSAVKGETTGKYENALVAIIEQN
jgi:annexin A7/11